MAKQLEVGDILIGHNSRSGYNRTAIDRVTPKRAYGNGITFIREYEEGCIVNDVGSNIWNTTIFKLRTEELAKKLQKQNLIRSLNNNNYDNLELEELEIIYKIVRKAQGRS